VASFDIGLSSDIDSTAIKRSLADWFPALQRMTLDDLAGVASGRTAANRLCQPSPLAH